MKVSIKDFAVNMEIKNKGIEFQVHDNNGTFKGDCYVTKTGLTWCSGKIPRRNGRSVTWDRFIELMGAENA